jgi:hypothetical protein
VAGGLVVDGWPGIGGSVVTVDGKPCPACSGMPVVERAGCRPRIHLAVPAGPWPVAGARTVSSTPALPGRSGARR